MVQLTPPNCLYLTNILKIKKKAAEHFNQNSYNPDN